MFSSSLSQATKRVMRGGRGGRVKSEMEKVRGMEKKFQCGFMRREPMPSHPITLTPFRRKWEAAARRCRSFE